MAEDSGAPVLEVAGLRKQFGQFVAVNDVSFGLRRGRSLAIVGESGSGKTTIARMITGLERPTSGTITACGHDRSRPPRSARDRRRRGREVQIVFQDPYTSLDPRQNAEAAIDEVLRLHHGWPAERRRARITELTGLVGLDERQSRALPRSLSGGQRQRVAIARALAAQPAVLILDESVSALDMSIQAQVLNLLADIRDETQVSYLLISHDLAVVRQLTDETLVLHRGTVVERGPTARVLDHPGHPYTQRLRASVPRPGWKPMRRRVEPSSARQAAFDGTSLPPYPRRVRRSCARAPMMAYVTIGRRRQPHEKARRGHRKVRRLQRRAGHPRSYRQIRKTL